MHPMAMDTAPAAPGRSRGDGDRPGAPLASDAEEQAPSLVTWDAIGLETMASMLVVSLRRRGSRCLGARCQWPRLHPLNERTTVVTHHPLIMVESTRQLALALERGHLPATGAPPLEPVSVAMGLNPRACPEESGSATDVAVRIGVSDLEIRAGTLVAYRVTAEYLHAGTPFGSCTMRFARTAYADTPHLDTRLPAALLHPPAAAVGAVAEPDVLVARAPQGRLVVVPRDPGHPVLLPGRPSVLPALAVLEAGRQAALLNSGTTAAAVVGLSVDLRSLTPARGARLEPAPEHGGFRFLVLAAGRVTATGTVTLLRP
ncbi:hypothetical protein [Streptomyces sp. NPDC127072]|uniref:hypothetical protein n=1 Tax=Streptomyces sp. NPDC127072 TaxID=3347129 RepID=UPI0036579EE4